MKNAKNIKVTKTQKRQKWGDEYGKRARCIICKTFFEKQVHFLRKYDTIYSTPLSRADKSANNNNNNNIIIILEEI